MSHSCFCKNCAYYTTLWTFVTNSVIIVEPFYTMLCKIDQLMKSSNLTKRIFSTFTSEDCNKTPRGCTPTLGLAYSPHLKESRHEFLSNGIYLLTVESASCMGLWSVSGQEEGFSVCANKTRCTALISILFQFQLKLLIRPVQNQTQGLLNES